jgi:ribonuclease E
MVENTEDNAATVKRTRRRAASRPAGPPVEGVTPEPIVTDAAEKPAKKATKKTTKKAAAKFEAVDVPEVASAPVKKAAKKTAKKTAAKAEPTSSASAAESAVAAPLFAAPIFVAPEADAETNSETKEKPSARRGRGRGAKKVDGDAAETGSESSESTEGSSDDDAVAGETDEQAKRRRRRRGGRGRRRRSDDAEGSESNSDDDGSDDESSDSDSDDDSEGGKRRRRRRRRGADSDLEPSPDDPPNTVVKVREPRGKGRGNNSDDEVSNVRGSTRLEAKKQRRREGREAGRRRAPILTEAEFLARREAVNRVMAVRQEGDRTQIAVLEDGVLVEHYVTRGSNSSMVGNVYLGRVQNVLPSMEAAFIDIGRGRNAVLYAGEVNWDAASLEGQPKRIEFALKSGDPVLVQVTKDPVGQKGARLTSQISLPGRFLVYVPDGSMTGISRKLPDSERSRLKSILKRVMPEDAGVIVRTASEGAPEDALEQDILRLKAQWEDISAKAKSSNSATLLYSEPDLAIKVVRDIFNEDVNQLVISGADGYDAISEYVTAVAPDLSTRIERWVGTDDLFSHYRVDEQLMKALDRKVYLPSGGSLVIDRTEAMTVVDVNTGKFTGQGGNLEQTVTRNNLEAAEEIVRQLRLRDIGGIIVVDFIDMVLESNRDLVLRRLVECLGRDRTKHQVAEVTSLGLVQMTRKRIGSGLIESFSTTCEACAGRGIKVSLSGNDHDHHESPKSRRPANAVDPADVAARALAVDDAPSEEALASDVLDSAAVVVDSVEVDLDSQLEAAVEVAFDSVSETPEMSDSPSEEGSV